jgi:hypothetical protein
MSDKATYYTAPLSILRSGKTELEALTNALDVGIVNAGVGFTASKDEEEVEEAMEAARERAKEKGHPSTMPSRDILYDASGTPLHRHDAVELWDKALLGWNILRITGGNRTTDAQTWLRLHRHGEVFFRIKSKFMWGAINTARRDAGGDVTVERPLSWREFRVIAAVLSGKVNSHNFSFLGWEIIQARSCGFHTKALFEANKNLLPEHCQPLSRWMIRDACDKLESLDFFARVRYSKGGSGGLTAYSFKLTRDGLIEAVNRWTDSNATFKNKVKGHRKSDQAAFNK